MIPEGAIRAVLPYVIGAGVLAALLAGYRMWLMNYVADEVDDAGNEATVTAYVERDEFQAEIKRAVSEVSRASDAKVAAVQRQYESLEELMRSDWDEDLQNSDDFHLRANAATERVFGSRGRRLQEIFAGGTGLPTAPAASPGNDEGG